MGIGGAVMNVPVLKYFGYPIKKAIGSAAAIGFVIALFGAIGFLICDRFQYLIIVSVLVGASTCFFGVYLSYFLDGATGGIIVTLQFILFILFFIIAPKYGLTSKWRKSNITLGNN